MLSLFGVRVRDKETSMCVLLPFSSVLNRSASSSSAISSSSSKNHGKLLLFSLSLLLFFSQFKFFSFDTFSGQLHE